jgi:hypothetical protein
MADKKVKDHISGVASGNLNAAEALFGIDANALKDARFSPEALAALRDLQADALFWAKNGAKIRKQIETVVVGTAEKTVTLGMIASAANKYGKPIINAKYNAALDQKKFGNFLQEKKLQAGAQFGQEEARHSTQMMFQQAENNLQSQIFRANVQMRYNNLRLRADTANHQFKEQYVDFRANAAMQLGSNAPHLAAPTNISMPSGVSSSVSVGTGDAPATGLPMGTDAIADSASGKGLFGIFGAIGRGVNKVRSWLGI